MLRIAVLECLFKRGFGFIANIGLNVRDFFNFLLITIQTNKALIIIVVALTMIKRHKDYNISFVNITISHVQEFGNLIAFANSNVLT